LRVVPWLAVGLLVCTAPGAIVVYFDDGIGDYGFGAKIRYGGGGAEWPFGRMKTCDGEGIQVPRLMKENT